MPEITKNTVCVYNSAFVYIYKRTKNGNCDNSTAIKYRFNFNIKTIVCWNDIMISGHGYVLFINSI
jgi:hypothetical protein